MEFKKGEPVLVTTDKRGVFFGYFDAMDGNVVDLTNARNCLYWSSETKGFLGLAANGPTVDCRIGPQSPALHLFGITSVSKVSEKAAAEWEKQPWG